MKFSTIEICSRREKRDLTQTQIFDFKKNLMKNKRMLRLGNRQSYLNSEDSSHKTLTKNFHFL